MSEVVVWFLFFWGGSGGGFIMVPAEFETREQCIEAGENAYQGYSNGSQLNSMLERPFICAGGFKS